MEWIKNWFKRLVGITKLEDENYRLTKELIDLKRSHETINGANHQLALQVIHMEDELVKITEEPDAYVEEQIAKREQELEEKMQHRWYQIGRQDAYAEMGIRNIEAHELGGGLVILPDGSIVTFIPIDDLVDVMPSGADIVSREEVIAAIKELYERLGVNTSVGCWNGQLAERIKDTDIDDVRLAFHTFRKKIEELPRVVIDGSDEIEIDDLIGGAE